MVCDYVSSTRPVAYGTQVVTIEGWYNFKSPSSHSSQAFFSSSANPSRVGGNFLAYNVHGSIYACLTDVAGAKREITFPSPSINVWHHIAFIFDKTSPAGNIVVYVDGALQPTTLSVNEGVSPANIPTDTLYLGSLATTSGFFNGMIDEVRIYSRALGQAEIQRDMNTGVDAAGNLSGPPPTSMPGNVVSSQYATNFSATEDPISEAGIWANGATTGLDWKNVRTSGGVAFGTQTGTDIYRDSTAALLLGTWSPDQSVTGVVHTVNQTQDNTQQVQFRLRSTLAPHVNSGYEINFRCTHDGSQYVQIVRWNGPARDFDYVAETKGPGISDGDTLKAEIIGTTIRVYINGALVLTGSDSTFATGNPGIGFYLQGGSSATNSDFGFYSITATGGGMTP
jgi:hypothetical protein